MVKCTFANRVLLNYGGATVVGIGNGIWSNCDDSSVVIASKFGNVLSVAPFVGVTKESNTLGCILLLTGAFNFSSTFFVV